MSVPAEPITLPAGSAAVTNLLRLVRSEADVQVAFAAVPVGAGRVQIFAVPPPGTSGALDEGVLEELARQVSADPELPYARVLVRSVHLEEPLTVAAAPIPGLAGLVGGVAPAGRSFEDRQADALHRVAVRLSRHFQALRELGSPNAPPVNLVAHQSPSAAAASGLDDRHGEGLGDAGRGAWPAPGGPPPSGEAGAASGPQETKIAGSPGEGGPAAGESGTPAAPESEPHATGATSLWWAAPDHLTGLPSLARFFSRVGRLLGSEDRDAGAFALVLIEIPTEETAPAAARALTSQLRYSDPVARIDRDLFVAAVLIVPGSARGDSVEERLGSAVRGALEWLSPVRTTHVLAEAGDRRDVDDLLRQALAALPGRMTGGGGAPWRGAGGSAARLPFP